MEMTAIDAGGDQGITPEVVDMAAVRMASRLHTLVVGGHEGMKAREA